MLLFVNWIAKGFSFSLTWLLYITKCDMVHKSPIWNPMNSFSINKMSMCLFFQQVKSCYVYNDIPWAISHPKEPECPLTPMLLCSGTTVSYFPVPPFKDVSFLLVGSCICISNLLWKECIVLERKRIKFVFLFSGYLGSPWSLICFF